MKTLSTCLAVVLLAAGLCFAQVPAPTTAPTDIYKVRQGDSLYVLEGTFSGKPWLWGRLVELNPFLKNPGRTWVDEKGRTIVLIRLGEALQGLAQLGIVPSPFPIERLKVEAPPAHAPNPALASKPAPSRDWSWLWWLIPGVFLLWAAVVAYLRMRYDPATAGPPVVPGGVTDRTAPDRFRDTVAQTTGTPFDRIDIRDLVRGRVYGAVQVRYADGSSRRMLLVGQTGYRAMVRRNGGPWTEEYMLQACGNDLRMSGARYIPGLGFRFVPEAAVEATPPSAPVQPIPAPAPAPTQPEPAPTTAPAKESERHFTFRPAAGGRPNFVDFEGFASFEVEVKDGRTTVRFS